MKPNGKPHKKTFTGMGGEEVLAHIDNHYCALAEAPLGRGVVDGDTLDLLIALGWGAYMSVRVRLDGLNTPELVGATRSEGYRARSFVVEWVARHATGWQRDPWPFVLVLAGRDKYGRTVGRIYPRQLVDGQEVLGQSLNEALLESGHAQPYKG